MDGNHRLRDSIVVSLYARAEEIAAAVIQNRRPPRRKFTERLDKLVTSRLFGFPLMAALLALIFWLTISGANLPSSLLARLFSLGEELLTKAFTYLSSPLWLHGLLLAGLYRGLAWVIAVMLPPMAIFFPIFTLLEDFGYLPRIAFNLDRLMQKAGAHGKQALTMAMGFGCNAAGVISARIIDSPRERRLAVLTNSFIPCNGRFPILIVMSTVAAQAVAAENSLLPALLVLGAVLLAVLVTLSACKALSATILKGTPSFFALELPPYRRPRIGQVLIRSFFDRTLFVLGRAVVVAAPAGVITWVLANITVAGTTLLSHLALWLEPIGRLMGLDGVIVLSFILGLPANEIVIPVMLMSYLGKGALLEPAGIDAVSRLLLAQGWTWLTAVNFMIFAIFHWPCGTTLLTIKKETGSAKWALAAALIPTLIGFTLCVLLANLAAILP
ncbi:MAG TPA: ferrous iron transporter B [Firmicutes bacterium]|nr:ferrous iron transporter B [Bacillota bacterium]